MAANIKGSEGVFYITTFPLCLFIHKHGKMGSVAKALNISGRVASVKTAWGQATFLDAIKAGGYKALIHGSLAYVVVVMNSLNAC